MPFLRRWATPVTIAAFVLMSVTGLLMFFHLDTLLNKVAHEYLSLVFVLGAGLHVAVNWRAFTVHFRRWPAKAAAGLFAAILAFTFLPVGPNAQTGPRPDRAALGAVMNAPLSAVAGLTGEPVDGLAARLRGAGFAAASPQTTLSGLSGGDRGRLMEGMSLALTPPEG